MEFRILGPLEVVDRGRPVALAPGRQRALLALLVLRANEVVSTDAIVDAIWGERPPPSAAKAVQNAVSQLRKAFGDTGRIRTEAHGYSLAVGEGELDADRFSALLADGRAALAAGDPDGAASSLGTALDLWRGPPLGELGYEAFAQSEIARLNDLRLDAVEEQIEAELARGRHPETIPELERLVREQPLRERPRRQLMLALYRSGRQSEALAVYQDARRTLLDELGIEPTRALQDLERGILNQDPSLDPPERPRSTRAKRAWPFVVAGAALVVLAAAAAAFQLARGDSSAGLASVSANSVGVVDAESGRLVGQVAVPGGPRHVATGAGMVWIESETSGTLSVIDERTRAPQRVVVPGTAVGDIAVTRSAVWLVDPRGRKLVEVDPVYGQIVRRMPLPRHDASAVPRSAPPLASVAASDGYVWVTDGSRQLMRIDSRGGGIDSVDVGVGLDGVAAGAGGVWAVSGPSAVAVEVAPATLNVRARVPIAGRSDSLAPFPIAVAVGANAVWVLNANTATVTRIDPQLRAVTETVSLGIGRAPVDLAVGAGAVWTANRGDGTVTRIDPSTGSTRTVSLGNDPAGVAVGDEAVWTSVRRGLVRQVRVPRPAAGTHGALPSSFCSPVEYPLNGRPDLLVAVPLSLQGFGAQASAQILDAVRLVFSQRGYKAGRFRVGFQACNDADRASGFPTAERCALNARTYVTRRRVVGVVGPVYSTCAQAFLPIANAAPGGPLAVANGLNTYVGLTRQSPLGRADEPDRYYPSGRRNYVRLTPADDVQAAAGSMLLHDLAVRRVFLLHQTDDYGAGLATAFRRGAKRSGLEIVATETWDQSAGDFRDVAKRVRASGADAVYLAGAFRIGSSLLIDLRAAVGHDVVLLGTDGFQIVYKELDNLGREVEGLYVTIPGRPLGRLGPAGTTFLKGLRRRIGRAPQAFTVQTAAAAEVLLDAIRRSNGTRASVTRALLRTKLRDGILGPTAFTPSGDVRQNTVTVNRIIGGEVVVAGTIQPPAELIAP
jgi:DNA-binding SARP family transcriptional activator/ABC-type branched-subunit amino acid transport system substrate-binding protein/streptogramin lyase